MHFCDFNSTNIKLNNVKISGTVWVSVHSLRVSYLLYIIYCIHFEIAGDPHNLIGSQWSDLLN